MKTTVKRAMETSSGMARIREALERHQSFLIAGHIDPDPDSLGSALALAKLLRWMGKDAVVAASEPVPEAFRFLPGAEDIVTPAGITEPIDALVVVDCAPDRIGKLGPWRERAGIIINIDHHASNPRSEPLHWVDPDAAAVGEMIYTLIQEVGAPLDADMAICLYAAIMTDTGSFRYSNTRVQTFRAAADLVEKGADPAALAERLYGQRPWSYLQLLMRVLPTLERSADGRIAWMKVTRAMVEEAGAGPDELEGLVQYPRMVNGVWVALLFRELPGGDTRVSFRSREPVDVAALAGELGGGGHARAAGCFVKEPLDQAISTVVDLTQARLEAISIQAAQGGRVDW